MTYDPFREDGDAALWAMHEKTLEAERHATRLELRNQLILLFDTLP